MAFALSFSRLNNIFLEEKLLIVVKYVIFVVQNELK